MMTEPLVIPKDVQLVPVADLPEPLRAQLEWSDGDVAITRLRSRMPSRVINADFAALFNEFQTEKTIVEAVMHYSLTQAADPRAMLETAFPILKQFVGNGLLVPPGQAEQGEDHPLHPGETTDGFTLTRRIRTLQDTEIYLAETEAGQPVALKIAQPGAPPVTARLLAHEAQCLRQLDGNGTPRLFGEGTWADRPYLAIAWCNGVDITRAAADLRADRDQLLDLCVAVLDRYAHLHRQGIMHGDIHPGNVMVDREGAVTLIDFGLAHTADQPAPYRGGVAFYYEPEYAAAFIAKDRPPAANPLGEQYALAAMLYQAMTGATYLHFSLEEEVLYPQIVEEAPKPFADHGLDPWPEVEAVLHRALAKAPEDRYTDVAGFAEALRAAGRHLAPPAPAPLDTSLLAEVLDHLQLDGDLLRDGLPRSPHASVNYGTAGVAYALYRMACIRNDPALLAQADVWLTRAESVMDQEDAFYNAELELGVDHIGHASTFHTPCGVYAVRCLIARAMGDTYGQMEGLSGFVMAADRPTENLDITLGKAGVVLAAAMLYETLPDPAWAEEAGMTALGRRLVDELWETIAAQGRIGTPEALTNLGLAHGWAGLLYATLRWHQATGDALPAGVVPRLDELAAQAEPTGRGRQWAWEAGQVGMHMSGWCNGSTGYVYLWALAHRLTGEARYLDLALGAGWHAWEDPAQIGTLCCGLAGRSYSLLHLYQLTEDDRWLQRARRLAAQAAVSIKHQPTEEYQGFEMSLYKGELGAALLLADLEAPETAVFPFLESEYATH